MIAKKIVLIISYLEKYPLQCSLQKQLLRKALQRMFYLQIPLQVQVMLESVCKGKTIIPRHFSQKPFAGFFANLKLN